jgi:hypothetical protein
MRIAMEKSGLVLAVKKLRVQRSNNIRYLIFVLIVRLSFCFHGSWRNAQFISLTSALWNLLIEVPVSRKVFMSGNTNGIRTLYSFSQPLDINLNPLLSWE